MQPGIKVIGTILYVQDLSAPLINLISTNGLLTLDRNESRWVGLVGACVCVIRDCLGSNPRVACSNPVGGNCSILANPAPNMYSKRDQIHLFLLNSPKLLFRSPNLLLKLS